MKNVLLTNVIVNGESLAEDGITNVMVFTNLDAATIKAAYNASGAISFDECYEVPGADLSYYLYEPCTLSDAEEAHAKKLALAA